MPYVDYEINCVHSLVAILVRRTCYYFLSRDYISLIKKKKQKLPEMFPSDITGQLFVKYIRALRPFSPNLEEGFSCFVLHPLYIVFANWHTTKRNGLSNSNHHNIQPSPLVTRSGSTMVGMGSWEPNNFCRYPVNTLRNLINV